MKRIPLEIDDEKLKAAQGVLGTTDVESTIHRALDEVLRAALRRRSARRIRTGEGIDRDAKGQSAGRERRLWVLERLGREIEEQGSRTQSVSPAELVREDRSR